MGASADSTAERNAGSVAGWLLLLKISRKEDRAGRPELSCRLTRSAARADSRLLFSEFPLVSVPPASTPATDRTSSRAETTSVAQRQRYTRRPQVANKSRLSSIGGRDPSSYYRSRLGRPRLTAPEAYTGFPPVAPHQSGESVGLLLSSPSRAAQEMAASQSANNRKSPYRP